MCGIGVFISVSFASAKEKTPLLISNHEKQTLLPLFHRCFTRYLSCPPSVQVFTASNQHKNTIKLLPIVRIDTHYNTDSLHTIQVAAPGGMTSEAAFSTFSII